MGVPVACVRVAEVAKRSRGMKVSQPTNTKRLKKNFSSSSSSIVRGRKETDKASVLLCRHSEKDLRKADRWVFR